MQRNQLLDVLKQNLPLPIYDETLPELPFKDKVRSAMSPYNVAGLTGVCDTNDDSKRVYVTKRMANLYLCCWRV